MVINNIRAIKETNYGNEDSNIAHQPNWKKRVTHYPINKKFKLNNLKIADIGCGEGYCSREFIKFGAKHIIGVDSSKSMIQNANKNVFKSQNETFIHADLKRNIPKEIFKCDIIFADNFLFLKISMTELALSGCLGTSIIFKF